MSLALTQSGRDPVNSIRHTSGIKILKGIPAIAAATTRPPLATANIPSAPAPGVWLSQPRSVAPGRPKYCA